MYRQLARYYDLIHEDLTADVGFVLTQAAKARGPILELGCGTGRLLLPLARAGYRVVGVDNSEAMLGYALALLQTEAALVRQSVSLIAADMTNFAMREQFGLVLISQNSFMHLPSGAMEQALQTIRRHMLPDGRLFLDMANPTAIVETPDDRAVTLERVFGDPETGETVVQLASSWVDLQAQQLNIVWIFDASPPDGGEIRRHLDHATYHYLYPHQVELLLEAAGFQLEALYGDYNEAPFAEDSDRMLVVGMARGSVADLEG